MVMLSFKEESTCAISSRMQSLRPLRSLSTGRVEPMARLCGPGSVIFTEVILQVSQAQARTAVVYALLIHNATISPGAMEPVTLKMAKISSHYLSI